VSADDEHGWLFAQMAAWHFRETTVDGESSGENQAVNLAERLS
jgi:hypothetical protein